MKWNGLFHFLCITNVTYYETYVLHLAHHILWYGVIAHTQWLKIDVIIFFYFLEYNKWYKERQKVYRVRLGKVRKGGEYMYNTFFESFNNTLSQQTPNYAY